MRWGCATVWLVIAVTTLLGGQAGGAVVLLPHLPADYCWWNGCSPTAAGMLMGWWDEEGYDVFPGDHRNLPATYPDTSTNPADYADARGVIAGWAHKQSGLSQGLIYPGLTYGFGSYMYHAPDSLADFLRTHNAETKREDMAHGLEMFAAWDDPRTFAIESYRFSAQTVYTPGWSYANYCAEIDAGRPVHLGLTSSNGGHSVLGVGYNNTGGQQKVKLLTTWHWGVQEWNWTGQVVNVGGTQYTFSAYAATLMQPEAVETPDVSAYFSIAGARTDKLQVTVGVGNPNSPTWSTVAWNDQSNASYNLVMTDVDCSAMLSQLLSGELNWFLKVYYFYSYEPATLEDFQIRYQFDDMVFEWESGPISLRSNNTVCAYLTTVFIPGDATGDGIVNDLDVERMTANWGRSDATRRMGDFNDDGVVGPADAAILTANWGYGLGEAVASGEAFAPPVPEPSMWLLLLGILPACLVRKARR